MSENKIELKYGCNPHQAMAELELPGPAVFEVLNGTPSYINILDALGAWQLARELKAVTGKPGAASFKHTSPAGAAVAGTISENFRRSQFLRDEELSPAATAYVRARGGDRMCSFGDIAAVSETVDVSLARVLRREVSDLLIAPGFEPEALDILREKQGGRYPIFRIDPDYRPPALESRQVFGFQLRQQRNELQIGPEHFRNVVTANVELPADAVETFIVATTALKYTQSNSVCVACDGQVIGMGAGQQSRVHCTRLACDKADKWFLQQHPKTLGLRFRGKPKRADKAIVVDQYLLWDQLSAVEEDGMLGQLAERPEPITAAERTEWVAGFSGVCLSSDALIPFRDNLDRADRSNVRYVAQTGSSTRDDEVTRAADEYGMVMAHTGVRCFLH